MNWTGFYVGADAGFVSNRSVSDQASPGTYFTPAQLSAFNVAGTDTFGARGFNAGVHAGYNWQVRPFVVGIEADYGAFRTRATRDLFLNFPGGIAAQLHSEARSDWLATARVRFGYSYGIVFAYLTGGAALASINARFAYLDSNTAFANLEASGSKIGWVIGAGAEVAIAPGWTLRAEYLRLAFSSSVQGRIVNPANGFFNPVELNADLNSDLVRFGASYKFYWPAPALIEPVVTVKN